MKILKNLLRDPDTQIDDRLHNELGNLAVSKYVVNQKIFAVYRYFDLYHAIESIVATQNNLRTLESDNFEDLSNLIHNKEIDYRSRQINKSSRTAWPIGPEEEAYLPVDRYWIYDVSEQSNSHSIIIRLKVRNYDELCTLEIASRNSDESAILIKKISDQSIEDSIYKGKMLALSFESGSKDEYGDIEKPEKLRINFKTASEVKREDFVVDKTVYDTIKRNVIDLQIHRTKLRKFGVPVRRGVLLYGPPGTGKTYACRYICGSLPNTTRIFVAGTAIGKVSQIFDLARIYQPSIVILEDVDLVFAARDISLYSSALGDLLDQMDGLRPYEDIGIILTTNSIERMEVAIKDRPGRISQCIYFGAPERTLRARYIAQYAKNYDYSEADEDELLAMTKGTTPAFIKEWVHRTVQFASERVSDEEDTITLQTSDFRSAYEEMKRFTDDSSGRIIGFLGST